MNTPPRTPENQGIREANTPPPAPTRHTNTFVFNTPVADMMEEEPLDDDFLHMPPPPTPQLVRQNADIGTVATPMDVQPLPQAVAVANEIHKYERGIQPERVIRVLERIMKKPRAKYMRRMENREDLNDYIQNIIWELFNSGIRANPRYNAREKREKMADFRVVFERHISRFDFFDDKLQTLLILYAVNYILKFNESDVLRQLYIDSYLNGCIGAYNITGADRYAGMTCRKGGIERLYICVQDAIQNRLLQPNIGRYILRNAQRKQYDDIIESFARDERRASIVEELNGAVMEWFMEIEGKVIPPDFESRKQMLISYLVQHMNAHEFPGFNEQTPEFVEYLNANPWLMEAIARNPPSMGGRRKTKKHHKRNKKTRRERK